MKPNKVKIAVQLFRMSRAVLAGFSGYGNSINMLFLDLEKKKCIKKCNDEIEIFIAFSYYE